MKKNINFCNLSFIDLTHTISPTIPHWSEGCGFKHKNVTDYNDSNTTTQFRVQTFEMFAGIGTHIDAPAHCFKGAGDVAGMSLEQLIAPCIVINVAAKSHAEYCVTQDDINSFEIEFGKIPKNSFVIIYTGWDRFWSVPEQYRNELRFPIISLLAAELLIERDIVGVGIDTLSPDNERDGFPVHHLVLGAGKYIIENIANAALVLPVGAYSIALPLKICEGTESPIRLVAAMPKSN